MADAIVSGLVSDVLKTLTSTAIQEVGRLWRLKDDVSALKNTYTQIQDVLNDAEEKQKEHKDVEAWLKTLRSASLEVENILDLFVTEALLQRLHKERGTKHKVKAFFSSEHNPLMVRARLARKVKIIRRKLDVTVENKSKFNLNSNTESSHGDGETASMETSSFLHMTTVYGRNVETEMVAEKICSKHILRHDNEGVWVYAIRGMGGVGKTTLAQLVYNHERTKTHFELQLWVYVSKEFQVKKLTRGIIESIDKHQCQLPDLDTMQEYLREKLKGKRFLIVLDDVWNEDRRKWEDLDKALGSGAEGSIVMVTTRSQTTSRMMAKVPELQYEVGCLSSEDSQSLFKKLAFAPGSASGRTGENTTELESIGKEIVGKCKGLPLAVKALGGLMWSKRTASEWKRVKDSDVWEMQENEILPALKLSYDSLPLHLRGCFSYCCMFPKGYKMQGDILIELWIANDLIPSRGNTDLYVIGEEIFNCLVSRSFFQDVQGENSMDLVCKMHDLMHDLARYVRRHDCSVINPDKELELESITPDELLHLSSSSLDLSLLRLRSLRSIFLFVDSYKGNISQISHHAYLRVLCLDGIEETTLPESLCKLKHLRYLSICRSNIRFLPESIIYLQNLQVLLLRYCRYLQKLPEGLRYLKSLRFLDNQGCYNLSCMPVGMKEMTTLRRLPMFFVGENEGAAIGELKNVNLLGWRLELRALENVGGLEEAKSANLKNKGNLISLGLHWSWRFGPQIQEQEEEAVLDGLEPNSNLKELHIIYYMGKTISPSWMTNLNNLVKINFSFCTRCESIPSVRGLPSLRTMILTDMGAAKCFEDDEIPSLQELVMESCSNLESLPSNLPKLEILDILKGVLFSLESNLPRLNKLSLRACRMINALPNDLINLTELTIFGCPRIQCLPDGLKELTSLTIMTCPLLETRYEKEKGADWPKISHVPYINLQDSKWAWPERAVSEEMAYVLSMC